MIAAYYDGDVARDHAAWSEAAKGVPNVIGVMYTTWRNDYSNLEEFAKAWWGEQGPFPIPAPPTPLLQPRKLDSAMRLR